MLFCFVPLCLVFQIVPLAVPSFSPLFLYLLFLAHCPHLVFMFIAIFLFQMISFIVITLPLLTVPLPLAALRVCVCLCVLCVSPVASGRALTAPTPG